MSCGVSVARAAQVLRKIDACDEAQGWLITRVPRRYMWDVDVAAAWNECQRPDWLAWLLVRAGVDRWQVTRAIWRCLPYEPASEFFAASSLEEACRRALAEARPGQSNWTSADARQQDEFMRAAVRAVDQALLPARDLSLAVRGLLRGLPEPPAGDWTDASGQDALEGALLYLTWSNLVPADPRLPPQARAEAMAGRAATCAAWADSGATGRALPASRKLVCDALRAAVPLVDVLTVSGW